MDARAILQELLESSSNATRKGVSLAEDKLGIPEAGEERDAMLSGMGKGALAVGAIALLLGTGGGRKLTGAALKVGSLAALGGLAYKSFNEWQSQQGHKDSSPGGDSASTVPDDTVNALQAEAAESRALLLVKGMVHAARADGHIDSTERQKIHEKIIELDLEPSAMNFLKQEIDAPLDPAALASGVDSINGAIELYLVSAMVTDRAQPDEKLYLERLAESLQLAPSLVQVLDRNLDS